MLLEKFYKGVLTMKKQKIISALLALGLALSMAGCDSTETTNNETAQSTQETAPETTQDAPAKETKAEFQEKVFVDDENCTFKVTKIDADNEWGYTLKVYAENKTDKNLMFSWDDVSVNGFMCDPFWATTVQAGKKTNSEISFSQTDFEENGIEDVETIEFTLSIYDDDDWEAAHLVEEKFILNPNE
jgi:hypothetical protein